MNDEMKRRILKVKQKLNVENDKHSVLKSTQKSSGHITGDFTIDLELVRQEIGHNSDVNFREFFIGDTEVRAGIIFVNGLSDKELIDKHILKSLMGNFFVKYHQETSFMKEVVSKEFIKNRILSIGELTEENDLKKLVSKVLIGSTALLIDGVPNVLILGTAKAKSRNIEEPVSEALVRGPRVGH